MPIVVIDARILLDQLSDIPKSELCLDQRCWFADSAVFYIRLDFHDDQGSPLGWRKILVHSLDIRCVSRRHPSSLDVHGDGFFTDEAARQGRQVTDTTLYVAAAILYGGCVVWSYFYNWRKTGSALLAISLTILQTISASFIIGVFHLWLDGRNVKRYEREHGIG
jgi:hypothetical protein